MAGTVLLLFHNEKKDLVLNVAAVHSASWEDEKGPQMTSFALISLAGTAVSRF